jgi:CheY-like chemotaxis protein
MQTKKVLLVDDDEELRELLAQWLQFECECVQAANGVEGLAYIENHPGGVDVIVTALPMPVMDGFEMIQCVQANPTNKQIPVLVLASPDQQEDTKKALLLGVDDVLLTPLQQEIAKKRIHNMLDLSETRMIHNVMEDLVRLEIDENIDTLGICPCPICRKDLMTLTLNHVSPKYVSTEKGAIMSKVGGNARVERIKLLAEIAHYAQMVKERPRHS